MSLSYDHNKFHSVPVKLTCQYKLLTQVKTLASSVCLSAAVLMKCSAINTKNNHNLSNSLYFMFYSEGLPFCC